MLKVRVSCLTEVSMKTGIISINSLNTKSIMFPEYDSLLRLGITDPKAFIKKRYRTEPIVYLSTCCAGRGIQEQIEASIEEALSNSSWVDIMVRLFVL